MKIVKEKLTQKEILIISNIDGKRGKGICQSFYGAVKPFREILKRRGIKNPSKCDEKLFLIHHRVMFNKILKKRGLKYTKTSPPVKRDFVSLRSTYINFRLLAGVSIQDIAFNCRNSVEVIEKNYAKDFGGILLKDLNKTRTSKLVWEE